MAIINLCRNNINTSEQTNLFSFKNVITKKTIHLQIICIFILISLQSLKAFNKQMINSKMNYLSQIEILKSI